MIDTARVKDILVVRNDRFGEFLLNIPAMRAIKEAYPGALLTLAVRPEVKELAECVEYADRIVIWDDNFRKALGKQKFDICVILNPTKEAHWLSFWSGIPNRVGYNRKWGILLTHKMADNKALGLRHEVEYNLDLAGLIGAKTNDKSIILGKLPLDTNPDYLGAIAVHPYTSDSLKQWPVERFVELAKRIAQGWGQSPMGTVPFKAKVVFVGKIEDRENRGLSPQLVPEGEGTVPGYIDLINRTSLVELAQILKQCRLLISCDSGPMHLAAAVGTPVLALFRNDLAGKSAKRWGPWGEGHIVIEKASLEDISVEEVLDKLKNIRYS